MLLSVPVLCAPIPARYAAVPFRCAPVPARYAAVPVRWFSSSSPPGLAFPFFTFVTLRLNGAVHGPVNLCVAVDAAVDDVRALVRSECFPNHLASIDRSDIDLFHSSKTGITAKPPTSTGDSLNPMDHLSSVLPSPLPPDFALLAVVKGAC